MIIFFYIKNKLFLSVSKILIMHSPCEGLQHEGAHVRAPETEKSVIIEKNKNTVYDAVIDNRFRYNDDRDGNSDDG